MTVYGFNSYVQHYVPASNVEVTEDSLIISPEHEADAARRYEEYDLETQRHPWAYGSSSAAIGIAGIVFFVVATLISSDVIPSSLMGITLTFTVLTMLIIVIIGVLIEKRFHWNPLRQFKEDMIYKFDAHEGFPADQLPKGELSDEDFDKFVKLMNAKRFTERRIQRFRAELSNLRKMINKSSASQQRGTVFEGRQATYASLDDAVRRDEARLNEIKTSISALSRETLR